MIKKLKEICSNVRIEKLRVTTTTTIATNLNSKRTPLMKNTVINFAIMKN
jgi:hypothetical protein